MPVAPLLGLMAAVAAAEALAEESGVAVTIKWPNDLVAPGAAAGSRQKVGGILCESRGAAGALRDVVIGIGVNVNHEVSDFPPELADRAASIRMLRGGPVDPCGVALGLIASLDRWYTLWRGGGEPGGRSILARYAALAPDLTGRRVRVSDGGAAWIGTTAGLTDEGALRVIREGGPGGPDVVRYGEVNRLEEV
jgi:BirA family biotin operon repressor/biotin-[acetyl-CoA-carboxylase] ligase